MLAAVAVFFGMLVQARATEARPAVVFFGDSLTAGYGLDPEEAYPAVLATRMREAGLTLDVVNAGLSGDTTAAGLRRTAWVLRRPIAVFVLALGGNDGLRGIPPQETERNLQAIIDAVRQAQPHARLVLAGMQSPPNMGPDFTTAFRDIFPRLAKKNAVPFVPFLLAGVAGVPELNQPDGIHPTAEGQRRIAEIVWPVLEPVLQASGPVDTAPTP
ncbi:MAG: arylesterase [Opitutaceae bacterium]|nr:arylesterase [Opitutaceae bacterium]